MLGTISDGTVNKFLEFCQVKLKSIYRLKKTNVKCSIFFIFIYKCKNQINTEVNELVNMVNGSVNQFGNCFSRTCMGKIWIKNIYFCHLLDHVDQNICFHQIVDQIFLGEKNITPAS